MLQRPGQQSWGRLYVLRPGIPTVGGPVNVVDIVVRKTAAAFIHTRDVDGPVARHVTRDLGIAN